MVLCLTEMKYSLLLRVLQNLQSKVMYIWKLLNKTCIAHGGVSM